MNLASPYTPFTPEAQTAMKRIAATRGNLVQGNTPQAIAPAPTALSPGGISGQLAAVQTPAAGTIVPISSVVNPSMFTQPAAPAGSAPVAVAPINTPAPAAPAPAAPAAPATSTAIPSLNIPAPAVYTPTYTPPVTPSADAIDVNKAIADTPDQNKAIAHAIIDSYQKWLGRIPDSAGYFSWLNRAVSEKLTPAQIDTMFQSTPESEQYRANRDVYLQIDPELQSAQQAYNQWIQQQQASQATLADTLKSSEGRYTADYQTAQEALARQTQADQLAQNNAMEKRGVWYSGLLNAGLENIDRNQQVAQGTLGSEFGRNIGNLESGYGTALSNMLNQIALYGGQYGDTMKNLMARREALIGKTLEQQYAAEQQAAYQQQLLDWEKQKYFTTLAAQQAAAAGGGGGGYGGGGGGGGAAATQSDLTLLWNQARTIMSQGGTPEDVINIMDQAYSGGRPGYDTQGVNPTSYGQWRDLIAANPGALSSVPVSTPAGSASPAKPTYQYSPLQPLPPGSGGSTMTA